MKLIRFGEIGNEKPGVLIDGKRKDLSSVFNDWDNNFFQNKGIDRLKEMMPDIDSFPAIKDSERWGACVARPGKVICVGLNYSDHAEESGMAIPKEPIIFQKGSNTVVGPYDDIIIPRNSKCTDWEVELGIVVGKNARYLKSVDEANEYIGGYCVSHDVSERAFQLERGGQWTKGKSCDNFNPIGPFLVTPDEIENVNDLSMQLYVNDKLMQNGSTKYMIFNCDYIIYYLSQFMTLEAGDIINTGTPPGVGLGMKPPVYLKKDDVVRIIIEGLGEQKQTCVNA
ncbi:fumarylacetoacetate hydrolase family protein [Maribacter sp. MMG018]|uniref:fumarylacetoacetate hydrolase family protein n=1 Tax=Maribacter sp. MMG018 TaxID=2822688 RepID=UPI001B388A56|nr:fumarylacetoacetate hydrolase family protein [Maribacter sp. MMG018]MBQ4915976.1 fumarylacetoacetate hydrolase family protein [Maribacter sp. MMG018]